MEFTDLQMGAGDAYYLDVVADDAVAALELLFLLVVVDAKDLVVTGIMGGIEKISGKKKTSAKKGQLCIIISQ